MMVLCWKDLFQALFVYKRACLSRFATCAKWTYGLRGCLRWLFQREDAWGPYSRQFPYNHHTTCFANRAKTWVDPGKPCYSFQFCFGAILLFDDGLNIRFFFRDKLQFVIAYEHGIVNAKPPYFHKSPGQDVHGKASQELNTIKGNRLLNSLVAVVF